MQKTTKSGTSKTTSTTAMKAASPRADFEKLDEVKLGAPTKSISKSISKSTSKTPAKPAAAKSSTTAKKPAAPKAAKAPASKTAGSTTKKNATPRAKSTPVKAEKATPSTKKPIAKKVEKPVAKKVEKPVAKKVEKKSTTLPAVRLDTVRPELLELAQKNGWLRAGLTIAVLDAKLVYTADKWATIRTLELTSLDSNTEGFKLAGVPFDVEIEYAVKATLGMKKPGAKDVEARTDVWLNNRGRNYMMTVKSI